MISPTAHHSKLSTSDPTAPFSPQPPSSADFANNNHAPIISSNSSINRNSNDNEGGSVIIKDERLICRYGCGCTHMQDVAHIEKFWHPNTPVLDKHIISNNFICIECGLYFKHVYELQSHLIRKSAWSNESLLYCKISYLVDMREWQEATVIKYHNGKHLLDSKSTGRKRWMDMKDACFYIFERPPQSMTAPRFQSCEIKDHDEESEGSVSVNIIDSNWVYFENITKEYTLAQSVLFQLYNDSLQETGHRTKGHLCVTESDKNAARVGQGSLLYGELLPRGANKAFSPSRLNLQDARVLFDMGMGTGKIVLQAFLQFENLLYTFGVELSEGRYKLAEEAVLRLVELFDDGRFKVFNFVGHLIVVELWDPAESLQMSNASSSANELILDNILEEMYAYMNPETNASDFTIKCDPFQGVKINSKEFFTRENLKKLGKIKRILHISCGNMFDVTMVHIADVVMLETDFPIELNIQICQMFASMKEFARTLTYANIRKIWENYVCYESEMGSNELVVVPFPFKQFACNRYASDRYPTSWSVQRGHHFMIWIKIGDRDKEMEKEKEKEKSGISNDCRALESSNINYSISSSISSSNCNHNSISINNNVGGSVGSQLSVNKFVSISQIVPIDASNQFQSSHPNQEAGYKPINYGMIKHNKQPPSSSISCCMSFGLFIRAVFGWQTSMVDYKLFIDDIDDINNLMQDNEESFDDFFYDYNTDADYLAFNNRYTMNRCSPIYEVSADSNTGGAKFDSMKSYLDGSNENQSINPKMYPYTGAAGKINDGLSYFDNSQAVASIESSISTSNDDYNAQFRLGVNCSAEFNERLERFASGNVVPTSNSSSKAAVREIQSTTINSHRKPFEAAGVKQARDVDKLENFSDGDDNFDVESDNDPEISND